MRERTVSLFDVRNAVALGEGENQDERDGREDRGAEERPVPVQGTGDERADGHADGDGQRQGGHHDAHDLADVLLGEVAADVREDVRGEHRSPQARQGPSHVEEGDILRQAAQERGQREQRKPDHDHPLAWQPLGERGDDRRSHGIEHGIQRHAKAHRGHARAEGCRDGGQQSGDDERVKTHDEHRYEETRHCHFLRKAHEQPLYQILFYYFVFLEI